MSLGIAAELTGVGRLQLDPPAADADERVQASDVTRKP